MSYDLKDHRESQNETAFLLAHENIYQVTKMSFTYMKCKANCSGTRMCGCDIMVHNKIYISATIGNIMWHLKFHHISTIYLYEFNKFTQEKRAVLCIERQFQTALCDDKKEAKYIYW